MNYTLENRKRLIEQAEVVSFDIFDTLLVRPYVRPTDLFRHLELLEHDPGFAERRIRAERMARQANRATMETTLEEIYERLGPESKITPTREIEMERDVLTARLPMKELFDYARRLGKKIILVSDMYHSSETLALFLEKCGYSGWSKIFVSSERGGNKRRGGLFRAVLNDLKIAPKRIVHFGDSFRSDWLIPRLFSIRAIYTPKQINRYFARYKRRRRFYRQHKMDLAASIITALCARRFDGLTHDADLSREEAFKAYWQNFGYTVGGTACFGYCRFIEHEAKKDGVGDLFFAARDGWTLRKIFDLFDVCNVHTEYVYAPRRLNYLIKLDCENRSTKQMKNVVDDYRVRCSALDTVAPDEFDSYNQARNFLFLHEKRIEPFRVQIENAYAAYLRDKSFLDRPLGVVDVVTSRFTSAELIGRAFPNRPIFCYAWGYLLLDWVKRTEFQTRLYCGETKIFFDPSVFTKTLEFLEFLMTAPEPPVVMLNEAGMPVRNALLYPEEAARIDAYKHVSAGEVKFAEDFLAVFGTREIPLTPRLVIDWIDAFLNSPTPEDKRRFLPIHHALDPDHSDYRPLLICRPTLREIFAGKWPPLRYLKTIWFTPWRTPLQKILYAGICALMPLYNRIYAARYKRKETVRTKS